ncbi:alpha-amylase family glycosyl hydrolase [Azospirillum sp.]|uniref:alpha-amylase family glycosyl hydrolase n=1 Tax=Azospirillum sp. TaxID=34012 RepID=UPI002D3BC98F|nr:alpha-amylase family glycosyl hydrolase [Azospirillum sp.]HYF90089.1 alpha-amylase family glycosyl hydrolase [Azospirillum sp.]
MTAQLPLDPDNQPMGATVVPNGSGVIFRCWAPRAERVWVVGDFNGWIPGDANLLNERNGFWSGFFPGVRAGARYKFRVDGTLPEGPRLKRDPYAREQTKVPPHPWSDCVVVDPDNYPWHDGGYRPPYFNDMIIYQLHVGTFNGPDRENRVAKFLDVLGKLDYLVALGVNALLFLPVVEFMSERSQGYEGSDIFSPEQDYCVDEGEVENYRPLVNGFRQRVGLPPVDAKFLASQSNQLKLLIELCHLHGLAVLCDVVYNHVGASVGGAQGVEGIWNFEQWDMKHDHDSYLFSDQDHSGPCWDIDWKVMCRQFLIDNANFFVREYHVDGFRFDEVSVIVDINRMHGWEFCQQMTSTLNYVKPGALKIAEYWRPGPDPWIVGQEYGHAGFDACYHNGLREAIRDALKAASWGMGSRVDMSRIAQNLWPPGFEQSWRCVQYIEEHDTVYHNNGDRIPTLAAPQQTRSWWAVSRSRVANGLLMTAPGIPLIFMGQDFLEDKRWADDPRANPGQFIWWSGLDSGRDRAMVNFHRFMEQLIWTRRNQPALREGKLNVLHCRDDGRVIAFHRWVEGYGHDVVVVASLNDQTFQSYELPWPSGGHWREILNSDAYDDYQASGNYGGVSGWWGGRDGMPASARIVLPANSLLIFAR